MTFLPLTHEEIERLKRLNQDQSMIFALKKLLLNTCMQKPEAENLAAQRMAQEYLRQAFHELEVLQFKEVHNNEEKNLI